MAKIDVVVPCYNYGRFLHSCVGSILRQSVSDLRVLIIDDASTDDSLSVATTLKDDPRVTVIAHHRNKGHISTYNEGIAWATAEYFLLLSADDLLVPGALQRAIAIMDENPDVVLTHGDCIPWHDHHPFPVIGGKQTYAWARHDLLGEIAGTGTNLVATPTAIGRTRVQQEVGDYKESLPHSGDMEMWLRFAAHGAVARIDAVQAIYRKHPGAMSNAYFAKMNSDYRERQNAFDSFFDDYGHRLANSRALRAQAARVMARRAFRCGAGLVRRGQFKEGFQLLRAAMDDRARYLSLLRPATLSASAEGDSAKLGLEGSGQSLRVDEALSEAKHERHNRRH
jgi:glycosyltransferase involved in cell wall biosynthesis